jgi:hypothetical protein
VKSLILTFVFTSFLVTQFFADTVEFCSESIKLFRELTYIKKENNEATRWKKNIKIYIHQFEKNTSEAENETVFKVDFESLKSELVSAIEDLKNYINPLQINLVDKIEDANMEIYVGSANQCKLLDASTRFLLNKNWAVQHCELSNDGREIVKAFVFVDLYRTPNLRIKKRLLRKKLAQSLGFFYETHEVKESIFYSGFSEQTNYSEIDQTIIRCLYDTSVYDSSNDKTAIPEEIKTPAFSVCLNPFQDELSILCSNDLMNQDLSIFNTMGQMVYSAQVESRNLSIPTNNFEKGFYFVRIGNTKPISVLRN